MTVGQLLEDDSARQLLPPQWGPIYCEKITNTVLPPSYPPLPQPSFWLNWTVKKVALFLSYPHDLPPRQPREVWAAFSRITLPPSNKDFIRLTLWRKLPVGLRLRNWHPLEAHCPLDNAEESVAHSCTDCKFLPAAFDILDKRFPSPAPAPPTDTREAFRQMSIQTLTTPPRSPRLGSSPGKLENPLCREEGSLVHCFVVYVPQNLDLHPAGLDRPRGDSGPTAKPFPLPAGADCTAGRRPPNPPQPEPEPTNPPTVEGLH